MALIRSIPKPTALLMDLFKWPLIKSFGCLSSLTIKSNKGE